MKPVIFSTILSACLAVSAAVLADTASNPGGPGDRDNPVYVRDLAVWTGTGPTAIAQEDNVFYTRDLELWHRYGPRG